jgi:hypothetical protein
MIQSHVFLPFPCCWHIRRNQIANSLHIDLVAFCQLTGCFQYPYCKINYFGILTLISHFKKGKFFAERLLFLANFNMALAIWLKLGGNGICIVNNVWDEPVSADCPDNVRSSTSHMIKVKTLTVP